MSTTIPNKEIVAMIFAAGLGTRLKPWTDKHPKALAMVNGKSLLQRNVEYLRGFGIRRVVVNVHHFAEQIREAIEINKGWGSQVIISDESDEVLETGGGLLKASSYLKQEKFFIVMNVDVLTDLDLGEMIQMHLEEDSLATLAVSHRKTSRYLLFDNDRLSGWKNIHTGETKITREAKLYEEKAFSGIHVINSSIFDYITQSGKFSIIDTYLGLSGNHFIQGYDHTGKKFIDVGKPESIALAEKMFDR